MRRAILAVAAGVALAFAGQQARACSGLHMATSGTNSNDAGCIFNVSVYADNFESAIDTGQQWADTLASAFAGAAPGANVTYNTGEADVTFTIPANAQEVEITVTDTALNGTGTVWVDPATGQANQWGYYYNNGGSVGTSTMVLENGKYAAAAAPVGLCNPPPPPAPPLNTAIPGPGIDPDDNKAAMNDLQQGNVPLNDHDGDDRANRTGKVE